MPVSYTHLGGRAGVPEPFRRDGADPDLCELRQEEGGHRIERPFRGRLQRGVRGGVTGKTIVLFATSGGSGLGKSAAGLRSSAPGAKIVDGRMLNGRLNEAELKAWAEGLKL